MSGKENGSLSLTVSSFVATVLFVILFNKY